MINATLTERDRGVINRYIRGTKPTPPAIRIVREGGPMIEVGMVLLVGVGLFGVGFVAGLLVAA